MSDCTHTDVRYCAAIFGKRVQTEEEQLILSWDLKTKAAWSCLPREASPQIKPHKIGHRPNRGGGSNNIPKVWGNLQNMIMQWKGYLGGSFEIFPKFNIYFLWGWLPHAVILIAGLSLWHDTVCNVTDRVSMCKHRYVVTDRVSMCKHRYGVTYSVHV